MTTAPRPSVLTTTAPGPSVREKVEEEVVEEEQEFEEDAKFKMLLAQAGDNDALMGEFAVARAGDGGCEAQRKRRMRSNF
jgi:hypothetical protein